MSPYLQQPSRFVMSRMIFFYCWCDEQVECCHNVKGMGNSISCGCWGSSLAHFVLLFCPVCHMLLRTMLFFWFLTGMCVFQLEGFLYHLLPLKMVHEALGCILPHLLPLRHPPLQKSSSLAGQKICSRTFSAVKCVVMALRSHRPPHV